AKPAGSVIARSARIFRSIPTPVFVRPAINLLYVTPFKRAAAFMRAIQSLRKSRLRAFRSRYAYFSARSTASVADRNSFDFAPQYPSARLSTRFLLALVFGPPLALGIVITSSIHSSHSQHSAL